MAIAQKSGAGGRGPIKFGSVQPSEPSTLSHTPIAVRRTLVLCAGFLLLFMGGGTRFTIGLTLVPIVDELGWNRSDLGAAVAVFQLVSAVAMFVGGRLTDRSGPRFVLGGGLILSGLGISLMSIIAAPWHAILLYVPR
jgi:sugar phosphate permease